MGPAHTDRVDERYVESVLSEVERIPPGRVASYGDVAERVGRGGPRGVGQVMAHYGSTVAWWRVVRADGRPVAGHEQEALRLLEDEGAPLRRGRVLMSEGRFRPAAETR